jgi:hypothetical protein
VEFVQGGNFVPISFQLGPVKQAVATGTHLLVLLENGWVVQRDHGLNGVAAIEHQVLAPHSCIVAIAANDLYSAALSGDAAVLCSCVYVSRSPT